MDYPFFSLQSPITDLQAKIDRYLISTILQKYPGNPNRRIFGVPVSQVIRKDDWAKDKIRGGYYGKIPVLLVDFDYKPICAILIESISEKGIVNNVEEILSNERLAWVTVSSINLEEKIAEMLRVCMAHDHRNKLSPVVNFTESQLGGVVKCWFREFSDSLRVIEQVGISEVVETLNYEHRNLLGTGHHFAKPKTISKFNELSLDHQYWILNEFASTSSIDLLIVEKDVGNSKSSWWPIIAVEIDGEFHEHEDQKFRDHLKNRICSESLLPLLRIRLTKTKKRLGNLAEDEIRGNDSFASNDKIELELIRYMVVEGLRNGSLIEQKKRQKERIKLILQLKRAKTIAINTSMSFIDAYSIVIDEDLDTEIGTIEWADEIGDTHVKTILNETYIKDLEKEYLIRFGKAPKYNIYVDDFGKLTGKLFDIEIPEVSAFCSYLNATELKSQLYEFGIHWLFKQALLE